MEMRGEMERTNIKKKEGHDNEASDSEIEKY